MKALMQKDLYVLSRQMRFFLLVIVIFAVMPGNSMTTFSVVYAAMMPYTALAYDERSKWDQIAAMMPYTDGDIVLSKYLLGYLFVAAAAGIGMAAKLITRADSGSVLMGLCVGLLMMALTLPMMFRFGVEKGRMFFILLMVGIAVGGASAVTGVMEDSGAEAVKRLLMVVLPVAAVVLNAISIPLAIKLYAGRNR